MLLLELYIWAHDQSFRDKIVSVINHGVHFTGLAVLGQYSFVLADFCPGYL